METRGSDPISIFGRRFSKFSKFYIQISTSSNVVQSDGSVEGRHYSNRLARVAECRTPGMSYLSPSWQIPHSTLQYVHIWSLDRMGGPRSTGCKTDNSVEFVTDVRNLCYSRICKLVFIFTGKSIISLPYILEGFASCQLLEISEDNIS